MSKPANVEVVFEPQPEGGFTVYSPDLPGMVTQGETMEEATASAQEAIALYVESMRDRGKDVPLGIVRRNFPIPA
ncbi:MAG: type II toxin-antitoxin system HicB family antitoxin [Solirubrobacterales bacterium]